MEQLNKEKENGKPARMTANNALALVVAYYLSKFDKIAYENLGFSKQKAAHDSIGENLGVKPSSVKNWRDEFDPVHDNKRVGWYQRDLRPSRQKVMNAFQDFDEVDLREVVLEILEHPENLELQNFVEQIAKEEKQKSGKGKSGKGKSKQGRSFGTRGITGKKAEKFFIEFHKKEQKPFKGELVDKREFGGGYDFEIKKGEETKFIEVKGLSGDEGGIAFTNKEWSVAKKHGDEYFLVVFREVSEGLKKPQIIQNPYKYLEPKRSVLTILQVQWNVSGKSLKPV